MEENPGYRTRHHRILHMRSPAYFIVKPVGARYDGASIEDVSGINREAEVLATPTNYSGDIQVGDTVVVHHNTFRKFYNTKHRMSDGNSFLRPGIFMVLPEDVYLYKRGEWKAHGDVVFIKPVPPKKDIISKVGSEEPLTGVVRYAPEGYLYGEVIFEPDSEHTYYVDGEKLYRMRTKDIVAWVG